MTEHGILARLERGMTKNGFLPVDPARRKRWDRGRLHESRMTQSASPSDAGQVTASGKSRNSPDTVSKPERLGHGSQTVLLRRSWSSAHRVAKRRELSLSVAPL